MECSSQQGKGVSARSRVDGSIGHNLEPGPGWYLPAPGWVGALDALDTGGSVFKPVPMSADAFAEYNLDPAQYGLPALQELVDLRIWDSHYHGFVPGLSMPAARVLEQNAQVMRYVRRMGIERVISLDMGGEWKAPLKPSAQDQDQWDYLVKHSDHMHGITRIHPNHPDETCAKMERWIRNGPCIGIKYSGGAGLDDASISCSHPNNDPIIRLAAELDAVVYIHTWLKVGGKGGRRPGGDNNPGESTPMDVAQLAARFPDVNLICGHSGGDWEIAVRAVRPHRNILLEFSGSDPHSGSVDHAVRLLGVERIVWGGHGPTRSYATELGKVFDSDLSRTDQMKVLGGNYRRLAAPILRRKGMSVVL